MFGHQSDQQDEQGNDEQVSTNAGISPINNDVTVPQRLQDSSVTVPDPRTFQSTPSVSTPTDLHSPVDKSSSDVEIDPNLIDIKQQALNQLSPLIGHLDQSPEEKFRTTMMMIQASDNQSLIQDAYTAAQEIQDEKTKAQALLDVINEINYFTQHHENK